MRKYLLALTAVAAAALLPAGAGAVTIANPSFEQSTVNLGGGFATISGAQLPGWTIEQTIDHIGGYWQANDGTNSIDLDGNFTAGAISQTLTGLTAGTEYIVSFFISANPDNRTTLTRTANLQLGNTSNMVSYTLTAANSRSNMLWQQVSYAFVADSASAILRLASTNASNSAFGLAVDDFSIQAVPEPAAWAMMIFGFGIAGVAIRRRREELPKLRAA